MKSTDIENRIISLRNILEQEDIDALIVNRADEHLSEYVSKDKERLFYISGFSGSAGIVIIFKDKNIKNAIITDGRYVLQAKNQVPSIFFDVYHSNETKLEDILIKNLHENQVVALDYKCSSYKFLTDIRTNLQGKKIIIKHSIKNLVDEIWSEREKEPTPPFFIYDDKYNGYPSSEKIKNIAEDLLEKQIDCTIISKSESVNWLLNIRGRDIPNLPIVNAFAIVYSSGNVELFSDVDKFPMQELVKLQHHCGSIDLFAEKEFLSALKRLGKNNNSVILDPSSTNAWIIENLNNYNVKITFAMDLCEYPKAIKNHIEIDGFRKAHYRDSIAMCKFLCWLENECAKFINSTDEDAKGELTEADLAEKVAFFRAQQDLYVEDSFDAISALGPNSSYIHYNYSHMGKPRILGLDPIYLLDSGAQYIDGTTDITRTVVVGKGVTPEIKENFTRVLKGLISLHRINFPIGTSTVALDAFARVYLWEVGLDYDHGTGHGVGHFLNVHEGPVHLSPRAKYCVIKEGMVTSVEPGYYKENQYGIRCENLCVVERYVSDYLNRDMLHLSPLTYVPFDTRLIDLKLLTKDEIKWINDYHSKVRDIVKDHLSDIEIKWLIKATMAI
ncbi:MAG: aminopeptidase P family protein [Succinivibrionaceae bacterium]